MIVHILKKITDEIYRLCNNNFGEFLVEEKVKEYFSEAFKNIFNEEVKNHIIVSRVNSELPFFRVKILDNAQINYKGFIYLRYFKRKDIGSVPIKSFKNYNEKEVEKIINKELEKLVNNNSFKPILGKDYKFYLGPKNKTVIIDTISTSKWIKVSKIIKIDNPPQNYKKQKNTIKYSVFLLNIICNLKI